MMRTGVALGIVVVLAGTASADKADALFKKAKKLLAEKKYADACATFEQVDKLDPAIGAKLSVGKCYEEWGRLAIAYRWYLDAEAMATAAKDDRAAQIHAVAEELDTNVPRVTLKVQEGADPAVVATLTVDGKPVDPATLGIEQRVDPGPHAIEFVVDGQKKKKTVPVERGGSSEITLDIPKGKGKGWKGNSGVKTDPDPTPIVEKPPVPGRTQRIAGVVVGVSGVVAIGIAGGITLSARGSYKDALADHCMGSSSMCDPAGLTTTHDARHTANIATVVTLIGGAAVIGGVVLYLTAPKGKPHGDEHALYVSPVVGEGGASVVLGGGF
ncbi:hypothetical protein BH11MYX3_BH11MYX3_27580 [soil metagenome]